MRIKCSSVEDFIKNLSEGSVFRNAVYEDCNSRPLNGDKHKATSFEIHYSVSTVLLFEDGGQALLECGEVCGIDRHTADGSLDGTVVQQQLQAILKEFCSSKNIRVLPGIIDAS